MALLISFLFFWIFFQNHQCLFFTVPLPRACVPEQWALFFVKLWQPSWTDWSEFEPSFLRLISEITEAFIWIHVTFPTLPEYAVWRGTFKAAAQTRSWKSWRRCWSRTAWATSLRRRRRVGRSMTAVAVGGPAAAGLTFTPLPCRRSPLRLSMCWWTRCLTMLGQTRSGKLKQFYPISSFYCSKVLLTLPEFFSFTMPQFHRFCRWYNFFFLY